MVLESALVCCAPLPLGLIQLGCVESSMQHSEQPSGFCMSLWLKEAPLELYHDPGAADRFRVVLKSFFVLKESISTWYVVSLGTKIQKGPTCMIPRVRGAAVPSQVDLRVSVDSRHWSAVRRLTYRRDASLINDRRRGRCEEARASGHGTALPRPVCKFGEIEVFAALDRFWRRPVSLPPVAGQGCLVARWAAWPCGAFFIQLRPSAESSIAPPSGPLREARASSARRRFADRIWCRFGRETTKAPCPRSRAYCTSPPHRRRRW